MNRETSIHSSDTLVVVDRSRRQRRLVIAAIAGIAVIALVLFFMMGRGSDKPAQSAGAASGSRRSTVRR